MKPVRQVVRAHSDQRQRTTDFAVDGCVLQKNRKIPISAFTQFYTVHCGIHTPLAPFIIDLNKAKEYPAIDIYTEGVSKAWYQAQIVAQWYDICKIGRKKENQPIFEQNKFISQKFVQFENRNKLKEKV